MVQFKETFRLIDKTKSSVTPININGDSTGNLLSWKVSASVTHTGISKTNGGTIVLSIDALGTFIRSGPILNDQNAKSNYLIEYQISQDLTGGGTYTPGRLFRMEIRNSVVELVQGTGECLNLTCIEQQYRLKESYDSINNYDLSPANEYSARLVNFRAAYPNVITLSDGTLGGIFDLMNKDTLKNNWLPQAPTSFHQLFTDVITTLAEPPTAGGTLTDYYFDFDPFTTLTKNLNIFFDIYGNTSSGVTISPTSVTPVGMQIGQSNTLSNQNYKNQVILKGNSTSGSLPTEAVKFNSAFTHAEGYDNRGGRDIWSNGSISYNVGDLVKRPLSVSNITNTYNTSRYFTCIASHTSSAGSDPILDSTHWFEDFTIIPEWVPFSHFFAGDIVTVTNSGSGFVNFYIAKVDMTTSGVPTVDTNWLNIWSVKPIFAYQPFYSYTPWTNTYNDWLTNISGIPFSGTNHTAGYPSGWSYLGWMADWNYTVANYDPQTRVDTFSYITMKGCNYARASPPTDPNELYDGIRILVTTPATGAFAGQDNRVAQWSVGKGGVWVFSNAPVVGDIVSVLHDGLFYKWNGTTWITINLGSAGTTAYHAVADMYLTKGASGIASQAIEVRYNWTTPTMWSYIGLQAIPNPYNFDDFFNLTSRGLWLNMWFPFPRTATNSGNPVGYKYGKNIGTPQALGSLNAFNLDGNRFGIPGWNNGIQSEDMGRITGIHFKIKPSFYQIDRNTGKGIITQGFDNQAYTIWAVDVFDRIFYQDFQCSINGAYETIDKQFGDNANQLLYYNRLQELQLAAGVTSPWNFFLREKEYTGVAFDWRFVKGMGWQWKGSNDETNQYKLMIENSYSENINGLLQVINGSVAGSAILSATHQNIECDYATLALDELYFIKELYVNSSDSALIDPRIILEYDDSEPDYYNAKAKAQAMMLRDQYYPLFTTYESTGDVRMKFGQSFLVSGTRVLGGVDTLVCSEVTMTVDKTGFHMSTTGVKKFVLPILTSNPIFGTTTTTFTISGASYSPHAVVTMLVDGSSIGTTNADGSGNFTFGFTNSHVGQHTITGTDGTTGVSATATIQVTPF